MTNDQINIAIAQACGWTQSSTHEYTLYGLRKIGEFQQFETRCAAFEKNGVLCDVRGLPDYCSDLNAMHEAERELLSIDGSCGYWETYSNALTAKLGCVDIFHATAEQRAEAFLRTLGKWEGGPQ